MVEQQLERVGEFKAWLEDVKRFKISRNLQFGKYVILKAQPIVDLFCCNSLQVVNLRTWKLQLLEKLAKELECKAQTSQSRQLLAFPCGTTCTVTVSVNCKMLLFLFGFFMWMRACGSRNPTPQNPTWTG